MFPSLADALAVVAIWLVAAAAMLAAARWSYLRLRPNKRFTILNFRDGTVLIRSGRLAKVLFVPLASLVAAVLLNLTVTQGLVVGWRPNLLIAIAAALLQVVTLSLSVSEDSRSRNDLMVRRALFR